MLFSAEKIHTKHQQAFFFYITSMNKMYLAFFFLILLSSKKKNIALKNCYKRTNVQQRERYRSYNAPHNLEDV